MCRNGCEVAQLYLTNDTPKYCELQYIWPSFGEFSIENADNGEIPLKNEDFVFKMAIYFAV